MVMQWDHLIIYDHVLQVEIKLKPNFFNQNYFLSFKLLKEIRILIYFLSHHNPITPTVDRFMFSSIFLPFAVCHLSAFSVKSLVSSNHRQVHLLLFSPWSTSTFHLTFSPIAIALNQFSICCQFVFFLQFVILCQLTDGCQFASSL